ncbi:MAG: hypothetical protein AAF479_07985 [Pseudomonadota bacterium]
MQRIFGILTGIMLSLSASMAFAGGAGSGEFTGLSNHVTKGVVEVVKADDGWEIHLKDSFWFDGAPDPRVGFGKNGKFVDPTDFEPLRENVGAQVYKVPANRGTASRSRPRDRVRRGKVPAPRSEHSPPTARQSVRRASPGQKPVRNAAAPQAACLPDSLLSN